MKNKPNIEHFNPIHDIEIDFDFGMSIADNIRGEWVGWGVCLIFILYVRQVYLYGFMDVGMS